MYTLRNIFLNIKNKNLKLQLQWCHKNHLFCALYNNTIMYTIFKKYANFYKSQTPYSYEYIY